MAFSSLFFRRKPPSVIFSECTVIPEVISGAGGHGPRPGLGPRTLQLVTEATDGDLLQLVRGQADLGEALAADRPLAELAGVGPVQPVEADLVAENCTVSVLGHEDGTPEDGQYIIITIIMLMIPSLISSMISPYTS